MAFGLVFWPEPHISACVGQDVPRMTPLKSAVDGKHMEIVALLRGAGETE